MSDLKSGLRESSAPESFMAIAKQVEEGPKYFGRSLKKFYFKEPQGCTGVAQAHLEQGEDRNEKNFI